MKKLWFITFIIIIAFAETSCSKYEEGPLISLRSKKNRLFGMWEVVEFKKDNEDLTQLYIDTCGCKIEIGYDEVNTLGVKENYFIIDCPYNSWNYVVFDPNFPNFKYWFSSWCFSTNKKSLLLSLGHNNSSFYRYGMYPLTICSDCLSEFEILRLTNKDLWLRYDDIQNVYTIKFEKK